ncbi:MAG: integrase [Paracoccaceae bacterium]|jgi:integrase
MSETISPSFTFAKAGVYYFSRRIPSELICHYSSPRIAFSLRTRSARVAEARARKAADQLDEYWFHLRSQDRQLPGKHMLRITKAVHKGVQGAETQLSDASVLLSEAVSIYLHQKGRDRPVTFHRAAERACGYVIDECGDKHLEVYTKADANAFRDALIRRGLAGSSITRVFGTVRAVTNFAASEQGLTLLNPFAGVYYDREAGVFDRLSMPSDALASVQKVCRNMDDDMRWLVSMVSDTGMRLAEVAGLLKDDICEDENGYLYVSVRPHPWRRLKTKGSERVVPLEGEALWAARQVLLLDDPSQFAFPRYNRTDTTSANSASAALNKWLKEHVPEQCTMHSFRHAMRDRLRAVECPADIVDQIGGWQTEGVGHGYGSGYPLGVLRKWMKEVAKADMVYGS